MNFLRNNFITRFFKRVTRGVRGVVQGVSRITGRGNTNGTQGGNRKGSGLKDANRNNVDKSKVKEDGYIRGVEDFAPKETPVKPVYNYSNREDVNIGSGYTGLGEDATEEGYTGEEEVDLWDTDNITQEEGEQFQEDLDELRKEDLETRKEILKHYISVYNSLDTDEGKVVYEIQKQVSDLLLFSDISHVPTFLNEKEDYTRIVKEKVTVEGVPKEEIDKLIDSELNRYTSVINDFIPVIKKGDKNYIDDWKVGIKVVDFMVRDAKFPQYLVLLTDRPLDGLVNVMAEGYLPPFLQHTPFKKVLKMFETMAKDIESNSSGLDYQFKKAYKEYKKRLPLYTRLRNNGNFPSINAVLKGFYKTIDNAHINNSYNGDAFLGLIEPQEIISAYTRFFYGNAKQTQAMAEVTEKLMKQNPNVLLNMTESGYTLADEPEGAFIVFAGHIVTYLPYKNGEYISTIDKAPSNIIGKDIKTLANMVSKKKKKKTKKKTKKEEPKKEPVVDKDAVGFKNYYDHEGALKVFEEKRNKPKSKKK